MLNWAEASEENNNQLKKEKQVPSKTPENYTSVWHFVLYMWNQLLRECIKVCEWVNVENIMQLQAHLLWITQNQSSAAINNGLSYGLLRPPGFYDCCF